jgi:hypothetical protein
VVIDVKLHGEMFETTASRPGGPKVNIADAGAGIGQILPLAVALKAVPPEDLPARPGRGAAHRCCCEQQKFSPAGRNSLGRAGAPASARNRRKAVGEKRCAHLFR